MTISSLAASSQVQIDLARMGQQLTDLQQQLDTGARAQDLKGFGGQAGLLLSAQSLRASADAKSSVIDQLQARFDVQSQSLQGVADGARALAQSIRTAVSANDGRGVDTDLELNFNAIVSALNQTWNGQPLFAGERQTGAPVLVSTAQQLVDASGPNAVFDEASRDQTVDLGTGAPLTLAKKASEMSQGLFDAVKALKTLLNASGGVLGQPITVADQATLQSLADQFDKQATSFETEGGRTGQVQAQLTTQSTQLQAQSDLLTKEIGNQRDADPVQISTQLNLLMT